MKVLLHRAGTSSGGNKRVVAAGVDERGAHAVNRRQFLRNAALAGFAVAGGVGCSQLAIPAPARSAPVAIGVLYGGGLGDDAVTALAQGLEDYGWVEGQNITIIRADTGSNINQSPAAAAALASKGARLIVTSGPNDTAAAMRATSLPIVMTGGPDPVASGFVASLAHPGGNVTGVGANPGNQLDQKRVELLRQVAPTTSWLGILTNLTLQGVPEATAAAGSAAMQLGLQWRTFDLHTLTDIAPAFEAARVWGANALYIFGTNPIPNASAQVIGLAAQYRLPAVYSAPGYVELGGLLFYGANVVARWRRAGYYVDRILRGANPGDLPIEQPTVFDLAVNLKTAQALGLTIPPDVAVQVTEWVQ